MDSLKPHVSVAWYWRPCSLPHINRVEPALRANLSFCMAETESLPSWSDFQTRFYQMRYPKCFVDQFQQD